jgi:hypothetical protein
MAAYGARGLTADRILIKLASTWEGIRAAEILEAEGINCNLTLLFAPAQAQACAEAGAYLISPFVGRITDWHAKAEGRSFAPDEDPGVLSVRRIYADYKARGIQTVVMGASFRSTGQIKALAGCDRLTISPALLEELAADTAPLSRALLPDQPSADPRPRLTEAAFRWAMNSDAMATEKLSEGIRNFDADHGKLLAMIAQRLHQRGVLRGVVVQPVGQSARIDGGRMDIGDRPRLEIGQRLADRPDRPLGIARAHGLRRRVGLHRRIAHQPGQKVLACHAQRPHACWIRPSISPFTAFRLSIARS